MNATDKVLKICLGATAEARSSYIRAEPISIRSLVKGANGLFSSMQSGAQSNRDEGVIR